MTITRDSLLTLEAYARIRKTSRPEVIAHRRLRSVQLGEHMTLQFEDEQTIRRQIQEMLHIEKIFDEAGIQGEIDAYAALRARRRQLEGDDARSNTPIRTNASASWRA